MLEVSPTAASTNRLSGERVFILAPLASMPQRHAARLLQQHGAEVASKLDARVTLLLIGDEADDWPKQLPAGALGDGSIELTQYSVVRESELWRRLGLVDSDEAGVTEDGGAERLYTPAMLADLVDAPVEAIRRWRRRGYLEPSREVGRLPYFAMSEVHVARRLAGLLAEGCSLARVDKLVAQLTAAAPDVARPLAELAIVAQEGRFYLRRGGELAEPHGQLLIDFDEPAPDNEPLETGLDFEPTLAFADAKLGGEEPPLPISPDEARALALELQAAGDTRGAIEACRAALLAGGGVEDHLLLAELLYRTGDLLAARERYYTALELDDEDVEARVSLACVLAETGEPALAAAALRGALAQQPDFADAHYHLARVLDHLGETEEAEGHWRQFLAVAPASPWAEEAADRLGLSPA